MIRRTLVVATLVAIASAVAAAPAHADPWQVCLVYSQDRSGICVDIGDRAVQ